MSDLQSTIIKKQQNSDSTFKVSPLQQIGFGVQQKVEESVPASKAELWESYQQAKQLNQKGTSSSLTPIQAKLTIGEPGDKYEQEADSMAAQVMQMPAQGLVNSNVINLQAQPIQRTCTDCQEEDKEESTQEGDGDQIQTKEEHGQIPELTLIQRKVNSAEDPENGFNLENQLNGSKGGGSPLTNEVRGFMEPRFGTDFSSVRVHTGSDAVQMNGQLNAQAFAHGSDIYFGAGKSPGNNELTAHELTHVVQQTGTIQNKPDITSLQLNQIMRDASDEQTKDVSVSLASDKEANDIGHSWIMIQKPDGSKDSYGFWPVKMNWLFYPTLGWAKGRVKHPDTVHKPNAVFTRKTTLKGLEKGINYAESQSASSYHILAFNCSTFARTMFEKATGETPPSGGLAIDSPNELADEITQRNLDQGLTAMGEPLPKNIPPLAPRYSLPASSPPPPAIQHKKVNVSEGNRNSYLDVNTNELTHLVQKTGGVQTKPLIMRQEASTPTNTPVSSAKPADPTSEAFKKIFETHWFWMKIMLETFKILEPKLLNEMKEITVPGINNARSHIAIEAALRVEFSAGSIEWLKTNIKPGGAIDQVAEVRDFMGVDAFDKSANSLLTEITQEIQNIYKDAVVNHQANTTNPTATNSPPPLPAEAVKALAKLKILSPLAAIQLQAVINAQRFLYKSDDRTHKDVMDPSASGLKPDQDWCGGFVETQYIPLKIHSLLKELFWSTQKMESFFTYKRDYDPYHWIKVNNQIMTVQDYHKERGSSRHWLTTDAKELDIRPGDIVLQDNRGGIGADHIQMVQSWDASTSTLYTIEGNGKAYQVDNNPTKTASTNKLGTKEETQKEREKREKREKIEQSTGYHLRNDTSAVGLGSYDLSKEPTENEVKKMRAKGTEVVRIVGIGRPSLVDFEDQKYLDKAPKK
jgi:hypothetical protein